MQYCGLPDGGAPIPCSELDGGSPAADGGPILGLYDGASCTCGSGGPPSIANFSSWLGGSIAYADDYAATDSWPNWAFPSWQSTGWQQWKAAHPTYRLVYAPGMGVVQDLDAGAAGAFDAEWQTLGQSLVNAGLGDAIIRIAHEFNGNWYWYQPQLQEAQFIAYWQNAVTAMRSVPGQSFLFFWNPTLGVQDQSGQPYAFEQGYPGDGYVDIVGPDVYDDDWGVYPTSGTITAAMQASAWSDIVGEDHGLTWFATFAAQHHKALAFGEWGLWAEGSGHGGGDDPSFVENIHDWADENGVAFLMYFNSGENQIYPASTNGFTASAAEFQTLFQ